MKCPKCGKELGESSFCDDCGVEVNSVNEPSEEKFETISNESKKRNNMPLFILLAIFVVIVAIAIYYLTTLNTPRYIFDKKIEQFLTSDKESVDYKTMKANANFEVSINGDDEELEEISDLLNDAKLSVTTETDTETQEEIVGLKLSKANDELINVQAKLDIEAKNLYLNLGELFKKTIQLDISELSEEELEITDTSMSALQKINAKKAEKIEIKEIKEQLKDEYFSLEKVTIDDENMTKNTLKMSYEQFIDIFKTVCKNLAENEEYINCYEEPEKVKENLNDIIEKIEDLDNEEDTNIEIDVYTTSLIKKVKRIDLVIEVDNEKASIQIKKNNDEEYEYKMFSEDEEVVSGKFKIIQNEDNNYVFEISVKVEDTEIGLKSSVVVTYDEPISDFDTNNVVNYEELETQDMYEILGNFANSKLYQIIEEFSNIDTTELDKIEEDDEDEEEISPKNTTSSLEDNVVKTYDDDIIKFNIPDGFEIYSSDSENYKLFEKELEDETIDVDVSVSYNTLDEYIQEVNDSAEYYMNDEDYQNVNVSVPEEITVNGNKFTKIIVSYEYKLFDDEVQKYEDAYIAYEFDDDYLYTVEIDGANLISDKDLKQFLTIEK